MLLYHKELSIYIYKNRSENSISKCDSFPSKDNKANIDISKLKRGIYFVKAENEIQKLIVE